MPLLSGLKKLRNAVFGGSSGSPENTPTAVSSIDELAPGNPQLYAQLNSAKIIETLVQIYGTPQDNDQLQDSADTSPSSKFDNVLNKSSLLATQSDFIDSVITPITGLYGIVLRDANLANKLTASDFDGNTATENVRNVGNSIWKAVLGGAKGVREIVDADEPALSLDVLNFPEYYVFIFANVSPQTPIPLLTEQSNFLEYDSILSYPKAVITDKSLREETLQPGTMIRIGYDGVNNKTTAVIAEVVEDKPEFRRMVINSMKDRSAFLSTQQCSTDSELGNVNHPTGDPIGTEADVLVKRNLGNNNNSIAYPYKENSSVNLVVALHGIDPYNNKTGQDSILQIVQTFSVASTLFLIPRGTSTGDFEWDDIESAINDLTSQGIIISSKRLLAWSGGVKGFLKAVNGAGAAYWDEGIYLADPSASTATFGANFVNLPSGIYMEYNPNNWGGYPAIAANFPELAQKVTETGGQAILSDLGHTAILQSLLNQLNS